MTHTASPRSLPDPLRFFDGRAVATPAEWPARRAELLETILTIEYGHLPPAPERATAYPLHTFNIAPEHPVLGTHYQLSMRLPGAPVDFSFLATVVRPVGDGPFPVIIDGDGCWRYLNNEILLTATARGYAVAYFNRVEIVPDNESSARDMGLYTVCPEGDYGALAAWAWGYHRVIDFVQTLGDIDPARIIVTGHSRGGKAALLAGVTDTRAVLTAPNNSGSGGAACHRYPNEGGERLCDSVRAFPYWYATRLRDYVGREGELPFDQHSVLALAAPRALLCTEARADLWASPHGTRLCVDAAREVYRFLGAEQRLGIVYRDGGHNHLRSDWETLCDFADVQLNGMPAARSFDVLP